MLCLGMRDLVGSGALCLWKPSCSLLVWMAGSEGRRYIVGDVNRRKDKRGEDLEMKAFENYFSTSSENCWEVRYKM